ncbi:MAG: peptidoglycan-binding protein, partial [Hyalangium sp.]
LEGNPTRAAEADVGFRVAGWYWTTHGLNALADAGDFREITHRINGGFNGQEQREKYYQRALAAL